MKSKSISTSSRTAVINTAAELFAARGYTAVKLKDIADRLGIKQASLYYHFPKGKEDLYVEVMLRHLERRRLKLETLINASAPTLESRLLTVGLWLIQQSPLNEGRITMSDMPALSTARSAELATTLYRCAVEPIEQLFGQYRDQLQTRFQTDLSLISSTFLSAIESLHLLQKENQRPDQERVSTLIDLLLEGAKAHKSGQNS